MPFLYNIGVGGNKEKKLLLGNSELKSLLYHNIFDYPLTESELVKWVAGSGVEVVVKEKYVAEQKGGLYFLKGKEGVVYKRLLKKRISIRKIQIAKKTANLLSVVPTIKLIAITGSLAMENASDDSDVDLLIITTSGTLWITRLFTLVFLKLLGIPVRRFKDKKQKDKICMNMWFEESALSWPAADRNSFTAHEIAQIKPLINKDSTYEKFIAENMWLKDFWPNSVKIRNSNIETRNKSEFLNFKYLNIVLTIAKPIIFFVLRASNLIAFKIQYLYMRAKITREVVTPTRAIFHPNDWGEIVLRQLTS